MLRIIYCGNLIQVANAIQTLPFIQMAGWVLEKDDWDTPNLRSEFSGSCPVFSVSNSEQLEKIFSQTAPLDLGILGNFGIILKPAALTQTRLSFVNAHLGILPQYRGRHPVRLALQKNEKSVGVTLHKVTEDVDVGQILDQKILAVPENRDFQETCRRLAAAAADLVVQYLKVLDQAHT